jgi:hypothetical protein
MCPAFLGCGFDAILHPLPAFFPGRGIYGLGLTAVERLLKLPFDIKAALAFSLLPDQLADVLAGGAIAPFVNLLFHPLLESRRQGDIQVCSHADHDSEETRVSQIESQNSTIPTGLLVLHTIGDTVAKGEQPKIARDRNLAVRFAIRNRNAAEFVRAASGCNQN